MQRAIAALALVSTAVLIVPALAVGVPRPAGVPSSVEAAQHTQPSKPLTRKQKSEQCFLRCWDACWGLHCVERCRCGCAAGQDEKPSYCAKLIWGLRPFG